MRLSDITMCTERGAPSWSVSGGEETTERGFTERGAVVLVALVALLIAFPGISRAAGGASKKGAFVPPQLLQRAQANPDQTFDIIVRGRPGEKSASIANDFGSRAGKVKRAFYSINGVAGSLSGAQLVKLADDNHVLAITPDVKLSSAYVDQEVWRQTTGISSLWNTVGALGALLPAPQAPGIAIIDSGIDACKLEDFGTRVVASVNLCSLCPAGATGDAQGHGTMVAGLAAGASSLYPGVAKNAPLVDLHTGDANGASRTSDVIAATDWILQNKDTYGIRVANLSMRGSSPSSFRYDPLDAAVESLWFHGVVVVAAVGNYGVDGLATKVQYSPGNDPFVISVGALDTNSTVTASDDFIAPWSAHGHTLDGFSKPDLSAPGRYIVGPVPAGATLPTTAPDRVMAPGYMWMSGTSLSAPMVSGAAAQLLARHPGWSPDQVKGALMVSASALPAAPGFAGGVGELDAASADQVVSPPNPNANLNVFVATDSITGAISFDGAAWAAVVAVTPTWSATDWSATDWSATDWSATDWSATDWSATDWSATDWSATDWSATDWSATDWSESIWSP